MYAAKRNFEPHIEQRWKVHETFGLIAMMILYSWTLTTSDLGHLLREPLMYGRKAIACGSKSEGAGVSWQADEPNGSIINWLADVISPKTNLSDKETQKIGCDSD